MPVRAFLDSDLLRSIGSVSMVVSMPVMAFLDSDKYRLTHPYTNRVRVSMPVRAFLDSDSAHPCKRVGYWCSSFNARQGIS